MNGKKRSDSKTIDLKRLMQFYDFSGQTLVVTGGTGALGGEIAGALAGCGAQVAILHRNPEHGHDLMERMGPHAPKAALFRADVLNRDELRQASDAITARFGTIHGLVNCAGGNRPQATTGPDAKFFDLPTDALRYVIDLNLLATILCCQVFGKSMAESGSGCILNVSSMAASRPLTRVAAYSASKAGIDNFTQWLAVHMAREYSPSIRVNAIAPGFFLTEQNRFLLTDRATGGWTARGKAILEHTPMKRMGAPGDLVGAALWLLSPAAEFVTGAIVPIDGGFSAYSGV
jgi:NAD(P)-dependent dehydrogenase (short-subunit alcohol dehydrogenase family)